MNYAISAPVPAGATLDPAVGAFTSALAARYNALTPAARADVGARMNALARAIDSASEERGYLQPSMNCTFGCKSC